MMARSTLFIILAACIGAAALHWSIRRKVRRHQADRAPHEEDDFASLFPGRETAAIHVRRAVAGVVPGDVRLVLVMAVALSVPATASSARPLLATRTQQPTVIGRVDSAGRSLQGVAVTLMPQAGGPASEATTNGDGSYEFAGLPDGVYRLDFDVVGFDIVRRNHISVRGNANVRVDVSLPGSTICQCIEAWSGPDPLGPDVRERVGQVVSQSGQPLAHARLEVAGPAWRESAYADRDGRFRVLVPARQTWRLTASDSGFASLTQRVSGDEDAPLTLRLRVGTAATLPDTERFKRWCRCGRDVFQHPGR